MHPDSYQRLDAWHYSLILMFDLHLSTTLMSNLHLHLLFTYIKWKFFMKFSPFVSVFALCKLFTYLLSTWYVCFGTHSAAWKTAVVWHTKQIANWWRDVGNDTRKSTSRWMKWEKSSLRPRWRVVHQLLSCKKFYDTVSPNLSWNISVKHQPQTLGRHWSGKGGLAALAYATLIYSYYCCYYCCY